jgi:hypothetical protein
MIMDLQAWLEVKMNAGYELSCPLMQMKNINSMKVTSHPYPIRMAIILFTQTMMVPFQLLAIHVG